MIYYGFFGVLLKFSSSSSLYDTESKIRGEKKMHLVFLGFCFCFFVFSAIPVWVFDYKIY